MSELVSDFDHIGYGAVIAAGQSTFTRYSKAVARKFDFKEEEGEGLPPMVGGVYHQTDEPGLFNDVTYYTTRFPFLRDFAADSGAEIPIPMPYSARLRWRKQEIKGYDPAIINRQASPILYNRKTGAAVLAFYEVDADKLSPPGIFASNLALVYENEEPTRVVEVRVLDNGAPLAQEASNKTLKAIYEDMALLAEVAGQDEYQALGKPHAPRQLGTPTRGPGLYL